MNDTLKTCTKCKKSKSLDSFGKRKASKDGLRYDCKKCQIESSQRYVANNLERVAKYQLKWNRANQAKKTISNRKWREANPERSRNHVEARRANKLANGSFSISKNQLLRLYSQECIYCGKKERITMDHAIPLSRGGRHSIGNLVPACLSCNSSKGNRTIYEFKLWKGKNASIAK